MQKARQIEENIQDSGAFGKFISAQKEHTPSVVRLINGFGDSTLFKKFNY
jgi:hypothetical protein